MRTRIIVAVAGALSLGFAAGPAIAWSGHPAAAGQPTRPARLAATTPARLVAAALVHTTRACSAPSPGRVECLALLRTTAGGAALGSAPSTSATPPLGFGPTSLRAAYELAAASAADGAGQTVAIVDAFDNPNAESNLAAYRSEYGLPPCTTANGCFRKVNQQGTTSPLPARNQGWGLEESLDLQMVSAICPRCHILLVEGTNNQDFSLAAAVATAARLGATEISNSYGEPEHVGEAKLDKYYDQPSAKVTVAAGDGGYGVSWPAASEYVTSVGGTTLWPAANSRGWTESAWNGTGSGCSTQIPKPTWQHDACAHRTDNDVAAVADPATPVAVYDTFGEPGWVEVGGTSVASPVIAAIYALLKGAPGYSGGSYFYSHPKDVFAVATGANGVCSPAYLCTAGTGYSGPVGLGTPDYTGARVTGGSCVSGFSPAPDQPIPSKTGLFGGTEPETTDNAIAALSPTDVWTVGSYRELHSSVPGIGYGTLSTLEHWNGARWTVYPSVDFTDGNGTADSEFTALSFDKSNDGWAAGLSGRDVMVANWNGTGWTPSPVLDPIRTSSYNGDTAPGWARAVGIAAVSPGDVWLAGIYLSPVGGLNYDGSFLEHWDGSSWSVVRFPGDTTVQLTAIHAISAGDVWAVAKAAAGSVALHYNGRQWMTSALAPSSAGVLEMYGVSGSSAADVWAVGQLKSPSIPMGVPVTEHWNGHAWSIVQVPGVPIGPGTGFYSVAAVSAADAWAVGQWWGQRGDQWESDAYLMAHWNGHRWTVLPEPQSATPRGLWAVSASGAANVWISGLQFTLVSGSSYARPFVLHHGCK